MKKADLEVVWCCHKPCKMKIFNPPNAAAKLKAHYEAGHK